MAAYCSTDTLWNGVFNIMLYDEVVYSTIMALLAAYWPGIGGLCTKHLPVHYRYCGVWSTHPCTGEIIALYGHGYAPTKVIRVHVTLCNGQVQYVVVHCNTIVLNYNPNDTLRLCTTRRCITP
jgi:hypothetical protein